MLICASLVTLTAQSQPTIGVGKANQPAGNETLTVATGATLTAGDQILITVEDSNSSTCAAQASATASAGRKRNPESRKISTAA